MMDNYQAIGYMLLACKKADLDKEIVDELYSNMWYMFDMKTEGEAEEQGIEWYRGLEEY